MEINKSNVLEIVNKCNTQPDKDYGQNYLIDPIIASKIVESAKIDNDYVLEIGPGIGSLTHFICLKNCKIDAIDIDRRMIDFLKPVYTKENINFILGDVRKLDISKYDIIIGNLPYNITTELIIFLLKNALNCKKMILMCQSETYSHFSDLKGKEYGPSSILIHLLGTINKIINVKPGSFYPSPKCNSTVFEICLDSNKDKEKAFKIYQFSKIIFNNRRKTITNNLQFFCKDKNKIKTILNELNIQETSRPEDIDYSQFEKLYQAFN